MASSTRSYNVLRKQLNQMGYHSHLSYQSVNLVKQLVDDLLQTAKCLQEMKQSFQNNLTSQTDSGVHAAFESLQEENSNLRKENEELQLSLIKQAEKTDQNCDDNLKKNMKLEKENSELQILNNQYVNKIQTLEKENIEISKSLLELHQKYPAIIQTVIPDFKSNRIKRKVSTFRHQKMEIGGGLPSTDIDKIQSTLTQSEDEYLANMLELANKRIIQLEDELNRIKSNSEQHFHQNQQKQFTVTQLEEERNRLENDLAKSEANQKQTEEQFKQLNEKNKNLEREICELKLFNEKLKKENDKILSISSKELDSISGYLKKSNYEVDYLESNIGIVNKENESLKIEIAKLKELLANRDIELFQLNTEKKCLCDKINLLSLKEEELEEQIKKLKSLKLKCSKPQKLFTLNSENDTLQQQQDYFKNQATMLTSHAISHLKNCCATRQTAGGCGKAKNTRYTSLLNPRITRYSSFAKDRGIVTSTVLSQKKRPTISYRYDYRNAVSAPSSPATPRKVAAYVSTRKFKEIEKERDYFKSQYETIRARELKTLATPPTRDSIVTLEAKNKKLVKEREDLQRTVFKCETQISHLQKTIKELSDEKDKFHRLYREIDGEKKMFERKVGLSLADRSTTRSLERETEKLQKDLHQICHERDTLQKRLQIATETQLSERCRLEKTLKYQTDRLHLMEEERDSLCSRLQTHQDVMSQMENQILCLEQEIANLKDINSKQNGNADRVKQLIEQMQQQLVEAENKSLHSTQELQIAQEEIRALEEKLSKKMKFKEKVEDLHQTLYSLDQDKDKLQSEVDSKTEYICELQEAITEKNRAIQDLTITVSNLESNLDRLQDDVRQKEKEILDFRKQCECLISDLEHSTQSKNGIMQQVESLQQNLETMIKENQRLHCEMDLQMKEQSQLKEKIQNYINEVARVEFLLNEKDKERYQLLDQFHTVSEEANCLEAQNTHLESETESARFELEAKELELKQLNNTILTMQQQIEQLCCGKQTLEKDNEDLQQTSSKLEAKCNDLSTTKAELEEEYDGLRQLCSQLQNSRDKAGAELNIKEQELETLQQQMNEMQSQLDALENEVQSERTRTLELENVIACTRQKECETQIRIQELTEELKMAEKQLCEAEQKLLKSNEEVACLRAKAAHSDATVEKLHREITNIKFEKEMLSQKLRECQRTLKHKNSPPTYGDSLSRSDGIISSQFHYDSFLDTEGTRNYSANTRLHSDYITPSGGGLPSKGRRTRLHSGGKDSSEEIPDDILIKSHRETVHSKYPMTITQETSTLPDSIVASNPSNVQNTSLSKYHPNSTSTYSLSNKDTTTKSFPDLSKSSLDLYKRLTSKQHLSEIPSASRSYTFNDDYSNINKDFASGSHLSHNLTYSRESDTPPRATNLDSSVSWKHGESSKQNKSYLSRTFDLNSSESSMKYPYSHSELQNR